MLVIWAPISIISRKLGLQYKIPQHHWSSECVHYKLLAVCTDVLNIACNWQLNCHKYFLWQCYHGVILTILLIPTFDP